MDINGEEEMPPFRAACMSDNIIFIEKLLRDGDDINSPYDYGLTPLHLAVVEEHVPLVKLLLAKGANVNAKDINNLTPLHIAAEMENEAIVKLLLEHGADINAEDNECVTVLSDAVDTGNENIIKLLLSKGADPNKSNDKIQRRDFRTVNKYWKVDTSEPDEPDDGSSLTVLHLAASENLVQVVKLLINHNADVNAKDAYNRTPLFYAIFTNNVEIVKLLLSKTAGIKENSDLLKGAVYKNCKEMVEVLLDAGVDVNGTDDNGRTALHYIPMYREIGFGHWMDVECMSRDYNDDMRCKIARLLLKRGANVDARDCHRKTALHSAVEHGFVEIVEALLEFNADVNALNQYNETPLYYSSKEIISRMLLKKGARVNNVCEYKNTPLHKAAKEGYTDIIKVLLEYNANVNCANKRKRRPLHFCAEIGDVAGCEMLLQKGAAVNAKGKHTRTALHTAIARNDLEMLTILLKYGADVNCRDFYGHSVLFSIYQPNVRIFKILLDHNVNVNVKFKEDDEDSDTLLEWVRKKHGFEEITEMVIRHIIKLRALNLAVCDHYLKEIDFNGEWSAFYNSCKEEAEQMKQQEISDSVSFHDVLTKSIDQIATYIAYASNARVFAATQIEDYRGLFQIYYSMMNCKFEKVKDRAVFLSRSVRTFNLLVRHRLPVIVTEMVMSYLNDKDMSNLIKVVTTFKPTQRRQDC